MLPRSLAWRVEKTCLLAWPALEQASVGDWSLRFSAGLTRRANSANPRGPEICDFEVAIAAIERLYRDRGLPPIFRTPTLIDPAVDRRLEALGYAAQGESLTLFGAIEDVVRTENAGVEFSARPGPEWLAAMGELQGRSAEQNAVYEAIVGSLAVPAVFVGLRRGGRLAALAYGALHDGLLCVESVVTKEEERGRGHGRRVLAALFAFAEREAARGVCLQVEAPNAPARRLYHSLGLKDELYRYHYRREP